MSKVTNDIIRAISESESVLVCGHIRPDGDCIGSALAVRRICERMGKLADAVCDVEQQPYGYGFLCGYDSFCKPRLNKYDLFIAVDCATEKRLGVYTKQLHSAKYSVDIDHHPTNERYGKLNHIVGSASSTCQIVYELFKDTDLIDRETAEMLYTGLSTDTGNFMHSNTDTSVFRTAVGLSEYGLDIGNINHEIYCNKPMRRIKLASRALDSIRLYADGKIGLMTITLDDLNGCECTSEDTEGLIDNVSSISGVRIAISICEQPGGLFRCSLRSFSADVAAVAEKFGGGGHKLASGCIISGTRYDVADKLISAASHALIGEC